MTYVQSGPAETTGYLILGYALIFGVMLLHWASFEMRKRNLKADLDMLKLVRNKSSVNKRKAKRRK